MCVLTTFGGNLRPRAHLCEDLPALRALTTCGEESPPCPCHFSHAHPLALNPWTRLYPGERPFEGRPPLLPCAHPPNRGAGRSPCCCLRTRRLALMRGPLKRGPMKVGPMKGGLHPLHLCALAKPRCRENRPLLCAHLPPRIDEGPSHPRSNSGAAWNSWNARARHDRPRADDRLLPCAFGANYSAVPRSTPRPRAHPASTRRCCPSNTISPSWHSARGGGRLPAQTAQSQRMRAVREVWSSAARRSRPPSQGPPCRGGAG
jgi:hypothetical protein